ncbi:MAG: NAD(P)H-dependent oxidoreductase subunit E, partial [Rhodocyclaceae bacterium]|nr:NAD(P)H-dependent oxidoreductase subunit E [Rhodocyclaceae bacterium]
MSAEVPQALIDEVLRTAGSTPDRLLQILVTLQAQLDFLPPTLISRLAEQLGMPRSRVEGVAGFYSFLHLAPAGRYRVRFSDNIIDRMLGSEALMATMCANLQLRPGVPSADGRVTVSTTSCTGMGDQGPAVLVNDRAIGRLNHQRVMEICDLIRHD